MMNETRKALAGRLAKEIVDNFASDPVDYGWMGGMPVVVANTDVLQAAIESAFARAELEGRLDEHRRSCPGLPKPFPCKRVIELECQLAGMKEADRNG